MSADTHVLELLSAYALDCLDEDETVLVSEHLAVCSVCRAELRAYHDVADQLALTAPDTTPPYASKDRLMQRIRASQSARPTDFERLSWWQPVADFMQRTMPVWAVASFLLILVLAISNLLLWQQVNRSEVAIGPGGMRAIALSSTGVAPGASGFIIIGADGQNGALVVDKLPLLDPEHQYQLWLIRDGQRTSGAVLSVDQAGYGGTRISAPAPLFEYSTVGITIEPAGGSPGPTGDKVLGGTIN